MYILLQISHKKCFFISISILGRSGVKLLEKYQSPPLRHQKKNLNLQENEKNITPRKSFNHPKIASTIMKKPQKNFQLSLKMS